MLWGIYSAIYGEVNVSVEKCVEIKGDYVEIWQIYFISVTLKSWSGRKHLEPTAFNVCVLFTDTHTHTRERGIYAPFMPWANELSYIGQVTWRFKEADRRILCNCEPPAGTEMCGCNTDDTVSLFVCFFVTTDVASCCGWSGADDAEWAKKQMKIGIGQDSNPPTLN